MSNVPPVEPGQKLTGWPGLAEVCIKFINGMTNERLLLLVVITLLAYITFFTLKNQADQMAGQARQYEETRTLDRQHCDDREKELRAFYTSQIEIQRKHDDDREDRLRITYTTALEAVKVPILTLLSKFDELKRAVMKN